MDIGATRYLFRYLTIASLGGALVACGGVGGYGSGGSSGGGLVASIVIAPTTSSIAIKGTQQYTAKAKDSNGNAISGVQFTWSSSEPNVANIDGNGLVTAIAAGSTSVTAAVSYGNGAGCAGPYCGGGGPATTITSNTSTLTVTTSDAVIGTAALGHAIENALVTLADANGMTVVTLTDQKGHFQFEVTGLAAPYMLKVEDNSGRIFFGFASKAGVANIDPITDAAIRLWYGGQGTTAEAAFAQSHLYPLPDTDREQMLNSAITTALQMTLPGVISDSKQFDVFSTPFAANGVGFDHVLDAVTVANSPQASVLIDLYSNKRTVIAIVGKDLVVQPSH